MPHCNLAFGNWNQFQAPATQITNQSIRVGNARKNTFRRRSCFFLLVSRLADSSYCARYAAETATARSLTIFPSRISIRRAAAAATSALCVTRIKVASCSSAI